MERRQFVKEAAILSAAVAAAPRHVVAAEEEISSRRIPRWRGFNIQPRFGRPGRPYDGPAFQEADFEMMAEWGFDFARLPLWYWTWSDRNDWTVFREEPLQKLDQAIDFLSLWKEAGWGWALWNLRGDFGILDSGRADVEYEDYKGHKLDRKMLELLRSA